MTVKLELPPVTVELAALRRRAMLTAAEPTLAEAVVLAPTEPDPKHGEHLRETAYLRLVAELGLDKVELGFTAFWAIWQHENIEWHHPNGGESQFLTKALVRGYEAWLERTAELIREGGLA